MDRYGEACSFGWIGSESSLDISDALSDDVLGSKTGCAPCLPTAYVAFALSSVVSPYLSTPSWRGWVSGCPLFASVGSAGLLVQIVPRRVVIADEVQLPFSLPRLELLLAADGLLNVVEAFEMDQTGDIVFFYEFGALAGAVLVDASNNVTRHADVERAVGLAGEDVDEPALGVGHGAEMSSRAASCISLTHPFRRA